MGVVSCGTTMLDQGVFNNIGAVTWDTTAKTSGFTAVSGNGYFVNTTSGAITVTLPSSPSAGDIVGIKDYANTAATNNITIGRNGSNIQGQAIDFTINTEGRSVVLVYVDGTQGWKVTSGSQASDIQGPAFVAATGGTVTCSGDYKIHTFTGPGTFTVTCAGNAGGSNSVDYLVIAGGAGGGQSDHGGGGGAGGFRESVPSPAAWTASPLANPGGALPVTATGYPISVGGGGAGASGYPGTAAGSGSNSIFSSITSTGGGAGGSVPQGAGQPGGSGGGGYVGGPGGTGNTPPVSPPQGSNGGGPSPGGPPNFGAGGGGGATAAGSPGTPTSGGPGGAGATSSINATPTGRAGGGGGSSYGGGTAGTASDGGGAGGAAGGGANGTTNTGGGGGGSGGPPTGGFAGGSGGSGIVIIRYKYQ